VSKTLIVAAMMRKSGADALVAWRTGLLLAVGGEFGLALLVIALDFGVIDMRLGQIAMTSVLFSMITGALLIRFNRTIATWLIGIRHSDVQGIPDKLSDAPEQAGIDRWLWTCGTHDSRAATGKRSPLCGF